jgi:hypothetical protein
MSMVGLLRTINDAARSIETAQAKQTGRLSGFHPRSREMFHEVYSACVEKARLEAKNHGHRVCEELLQDGSIKLQIIEGGG